MTTKRKVKEKDEFSKNLKKVRDKLPTSILEVELDVLCPQKKIIEESHEHARVIRNTTMGEMQKRLKEMKKTKLYKTALREAINVSKEVVKLEEKLTKEKDKKQKKNLQNDLKKIKAKKKYKNDRLENIRKKFGVTFEGARKYAESMLKKYNKAQAVIALKMAERVWISIERMMFGDAEKPRYIGRGYYTSLEGKQNEKCIMLKQDKEGSFFIKYLGQEMYLKPKKNDLFVEETLSNIDFYNKNKESIDAENVKRLLEEKELISTYRVKYNRIVRKEIRGEDRYYVQIVIEGDAVPKRKKDGSFRHTLGKGKNGLDPGMQTTAYVTENEVNLYNLAERGKRNEKESSVCNEHKIVQEDE